MTTRRQVLVYLAAASLLIPASAIALEEGAFTASAFEVAQNEGKPILIHVSATWCETCLAQKEILEKLEAEEAFRVYSVYTVDFDTQKDAMRTFNAPSRSTLIVFKGKDEVGRLVGDTSEEAIRALLEKGI